MSEQTIQGVVILDADGKPYRTMGGALTVYETVGAAAPIAAAWSDKKQSPAFASGAPYTVAPCELKIH